MIAGLAMLLTASSLGNGLAIDDYFHRMVAQDGRGYLGDARSRLDQFAFFPTDATYREHALRVGVWPWWGSHVKILFLRPVTALTHWLDYAQWPHPTWLAHLHSVLWYGALVIAVSVLYRRTLAAAWTAGLATLLFALDSGHGVPVGWLATRNMLLGVLFGVAAITCHHRWRSEGWRPGRVLGPTALALSLLSAEYGIGALGYLIAYALVMERSDWRTRALSISPYLALVICWQLAHRALGYGVANTGLYTDPVHQPLVFASQLFERAPVLLASQLTLPFGDAAIAMPASGALPLAIAMLVILASFVGLFWSELARDRVQRWYAVGALLAVVPACTTFFHSRMGLFASVGAAALLAGFARRAFDGARSRFFAATAAVLVLRHTVLSAALLSVNAGLPRKFDELMRACIGSLPDDPALAQQTLVVVSTPHIFASNFVTTMREHGEGYHGVPPAKIRTLGETVQAVQVRRIDLHTLEVEVAEGYLGAPPYQIAWIAGDTRPAGFSVELGDSRFEVMAATEDGRPRRVHARFAEPLESRSYRWVAWRRDRFVAFTPPQVGESVTLPAMDLRDVLPKLD